MGGEQGKKRATRFEDLIAWQKARQLTRAIFEVTDHPSFPRHYSFRNQVQDASISIMANIAEGSEKMHTREFHQFLSFAKASCAEVRSHLYVALDAGYIDRLTFDRLMAMAEETSRVLGGLRSAIARRSTTD